MKIEGTPEPLEREEVRVAICLDLAIEFILRRLPSILKRLLRPKKPVNDGIYLFYCGFSITVTYLTEEHLQENDSLRLDTETFHSFALELEFFPLYFNFKVWVLFFWVHSNGKNKIK